jgi:hypothetical protein
MFFFISVFPPIGTMRIDRKSRKWTDPRQSRFKEFLVCLSVGPDECPDRYGEDYIATLVRNHEFASGPAWKPAVSVRSREDVVDDLLDGAESSTLVGQFVALGVANDRRSLLDVKIVTAHDGYQGSLRA